MSAFEMGCYGRRLHRPTDHTHWENDGGCFWKGYFSFQFCRMRASSSVTFFPCVCHDRDGRQSLFHALFVSDCCVKCAYMLKYLMYCPKTKCKIIETLKIIIFTFNLIFFNLLILNYCTLVDNFFF
jgi:hypothetical protein